MRLCTLSTGAITLKCLGPWGLTLDFHALPVFGILNNRAQSHPSPPSCIPSIGLIPLKCPGFAPWPLNFMPFQSMGSETLWHSQTQSFFWYPVDWPNTLVMPWSWVPTPEYSHNLLPPLKKNTSTDSNSCLRVSLWRSEGTSRCIAAARCHNRDFRRSLGCSINCYPYRRRTTVAASSCVSTSYQCL